MRYRFTSNCWCRLNRVAAKVEIKAMPNQMVAIVHFCVELRVTSVDNFRVMVDIFCDFAKKITLLRYEFNLPTERPSVSSPLREKHPDPLCYSYVNNLTELFFPVRGSISDVVLKEESRLLSAASLG